MTLLSAAMVAARLSWLDSGAESVGVGLAERGVAVCSVVLRGVVRLVGRAVGRPAGNGLAVTRRELGVDVDR